MKTPMVLLASLIASTVWAAGPDLTLEAAQKTAFDNNPQLKQLQLVSDIAANGKLEALSTYLPHLSITGSHMFDQKYMLTTLPFNGELVTMPAITPSTEFSLNASITVWDGMDGWNRYRAALLEKDAKDLELSRGRLRLNTDVRTKFYQALGAQVLIEVADQNIKTLEQHLNDVGSQIRGGVSTKFDSLRIEVQLEDARAERIAAEDNLVIARAKLYQTLGESDDGSPLRGELPSDWSGIKLENLRMDLAAREDRQAEALQEQRSERLSAAAKGYWSPRVSLIGQKQWYNNLNRDLANENGNFRDDYMLGVSLTWNLFDGGASIARERTAAQSLEVAHLKMKELDDQIPVDFEFWKRRFRYSVANYKARQAAIAKSQESVRLAKNGVRAGTRTNTEVLDAELDLNQSKAKSVRSQIDAMEALGNLELAMGRSF